MAKLKDSLTGRYSFKHQFIAIILDVNPGINPIFQSYTANSKLVKRDVRIGNGYSLPFVDIDGVDIFEHITVCSKSC